ncbi:MULTISPECIES: FUSC family protein [Dyella]|nr:MULTISPECIES: FUSC family protein [Dyella]
MTRSVTALGTFTEACATMAAAVASMACAWAAAPGSGAPVMAVVLAISLSRSQLDKDMRGRLEAAIVLPLVGLVALAVGMLLHRWPWIGAIVFTAGMALAIWLRRFGPMARRAGSLIALPFVTLLTVPHVHAIGTHGMPGFLIPILVALIALFWVTATHMLVLRLHGKRPDDDEYPPVTPTQSPGSPGLPASTRMAIQMAVALAAAFVVGFVFFPERWSWVVLTAFIVNIGNRGRIDVVHKSGMRVLGATMGTLFALVLSHQAMPSPPMTTAIILASLFMGIWLRPFGYAWWALFITIALALLQGFQGGAPIALLLLRLEEIAIGAIIGVMAAWFVLPVRSTDVVRRRIANALAALAEALDPATEHRQARAFDDAMDELALVAPPFRLARALTRHRRAKRPADWADTLLDGRDLADTLIARQLTPAKVRQAVGVARKSLREPDGLQEALLHLRQTLEAELSAAPPSDIIDRA